MPRVLTDSQVAAYERDGFLAPIDAISPEEAAACMAKIEAFERDGDGDIGAVVRPRSVLAFKWLLDLARNPAIIGTFQDIMGPDVLLYLSAIWSKAPGAGQYVSWHQDGAYYAFDRHVGATIWVALTDSTSEKGCIRALPGSHKEPVREHEETFSADNLLSRGQTIVDVDESRAVDLDLRAGQFSIHHEMTVHGSAPNLTDSRRVGVSLSCFPPAVHVETGPRSAVLLAGEAAPHWTVNTEPRFDLDPVALAELDSVRQAYYDAATHRNEAERAKRT